MRNFLFCGLFLFSTWIFAADEADYYFSEANKRLSAGQTKESATYFGHAVHSNADLFYVIQENGTLEKLLETSSKDVAQAVLQMCVETGKLSKTEDPFTLYYSAWAHWIMEAKAEARKEWTRARGILKKQGVDSILVDRLVQRLEHPESAKAQSDESSPEEQGKETDKKEPHKTGSVGSKI